MTFREWYRMTEREIRWNRSFLYRVFNKIGLA